MDPILPRLATLLFLCHASLVACTEEKFANCSTNYTVLENALLETDDNMYQLTTAFYPPNDDPPLYVNVYYHFSDNNQVEYIWSSASLYLSVHPRPLGYLSLFFCYIEDSRIINLNLQLPIECSELANNTSSDKDNFLFVITQRLRLYAKYLGKIRQFNTGFEARVVSENEREDKFVHRRGVKLYFSLVLVCPIISLILCYFYVKGARLYIRECFSKPKYHSTLASLICVGTAFSIFVTIMDTLAWTTKTIHEAYQSKIIITLFIFEYVLLAIIFSMLVYLCCCHLWPSRVCFTDDFLLDHFKICYFPLFCSYKKVIVNAQEAKLWFLILGFIPPLFCFTSHIGFIIGGWISLEERSLALVIFYLFVFIFFFVSFQQIYLKLADCEGQCCIPDDFPNTNGEIDHMDETIFQKAMNKKDGLNFSFLLLELFVIIFLGGTVIYAGSGFSYLPILQVVDDVSIHVYTLGQYAFVFAVFILTYNIVALRSKQKSGTVEKIIRYWKHLYINRQPPANPPPANPPPANPPPANPPPANPPAANPLQSLNILSDEDKASALMAAYIFHAMKSHQEGDTSLDALLSSIAKPVPEAAAKQQPQADVENGGEN